MIGSLAQATSETRLPPLGGRWLSAYRLLWFAFAFAAVAVMTASLYTGAAHPTVQALRLIKGAIVISVCAILLRRRRNDPVAALLSLAFLVWTITSSFDFTSGDLLPRLLDRIRFLLFALALLLFPDGSWLPGWTRRVAWAAAGVCALGVAEDLGLVPTRLFLPLAIACVVAAVSALVTRFRTAPSQSVRQQLKWIALGLVAGIGLILAARGGASLSGTSPTLAAMPILWEGMFQLGIIVVALGFLVSLLRYRLYDAETAISRSAVLAVLTVTLVATFAGTEAAIEWVGQQHLGMGLGNVSAAMAAALAAVLLNPLHNRISDWAEQYFQRDILVLKRDLPELLDHLAASATPPRLGAAILPRISNAVHARCSALLICGKSAAAANRVALDEVRRWSSEVRPAAGLPERDPDDALFPIRLELDCPVTGKMAWLLLGRRPDGSLPGSDDLAALESLRPLIRRALAWTMAREAARASAARQWRWVRRQVAELHQPVPPSRPRECGE